MGVSTDGLLIYGYPLDEYDEVPDWLNEDDEIEETLRRMGLNRADYDFEWVKEEDSWQYNPSNPTEHERYNADRSILKKQAKEQFGLDYRGVGIAVTCSYDHPIYYVSAKTIRNARGHGKQLDPMSDLYLTSTQLTKYLDWIEFMDLPKKESSWWLESIWG